MVRPSHNIISIQSSVTTVQDDSRIYLRNLINGSESRLFLSLRQHETAANNAAVNVLTGEHNQVIVPDRSLIRARRELYYQNLNRSVENEVIVDRQALTPNVEHVFRSTENLQSVIVPVDINNFTVENLNQNSAVFVNNLRRPLNVVDRGERIQITNDLFPDYQIIEAGIRRLRQNLNESLLAPEINNFTRERLYGLINNLALHRDTLIRNIDDHNLHYRTESHVMSGLSSYEFDFVYQILELFTESVTSAGLTTIGQLVNILRRPYVVQYLLVVLTPAILNFTYFELFNFRLNRITRFFEGALNALYGSHNILSGIHDRMANLQRDLDLSLNRARLAIQSTVSRNVNRNVRRSNFWINLEQYITAPLLRNISIILRYFGISVTSGLVVYISTRGTNSNVPTYPPIYPPLYPDRQPSGSGPATDLAIFAAAVMSFVKDLTKFRRR